MHPLLLTKRYIQDIISICSDDLPLPLPSDVEDILLVPPFDESLAYVLTQHGAPNTEYFTRILQ